MKREDIIQMAKEATIYDLLADGVIKYGELELFAALVAGAEREACIDECTFDRTSADIEIALRARGQ